jgi:hypothetical protein
MKKNPNNDFEAKRDSAQREILTPPFPRDVTHYDDGTWECSAESFDLMAQSFKRFGFELDYRWSFNTLYERFSFVLRSASLISGLDLGWVEEKHTPELVAYLRAVVAGDDVRVGQTLSEALIQDELRRAAVLESSLLSLAPGPKSEAPAGRLAVETPRTEAGMASESPLRPRPTLRLV